MEIIAENIHSKDPYVATYKNILTDEECQHFIDISRESLHINYYFLNTMLIWNMKKNCSIENW